MHVSSRSAVAVTLLGSHILLQSHVAAVTSAALHRVTPLGRYSPRQMQGRYAALHGIHKHLSKVAPQ